jgi:hypothetical protein
LLHVKNTQGMMLERSKLSRCFTIAPHPPTQAFMVLGEGQWTQDKRVRWSHQWVIVVRAAP